MAIIVWKAIKIRVFHYYNNIFKMLQIYLWHVSLFKDFFMFWKHINANHLMLFCIINIYLNLNNTNKKYYNQT